METKKITASDVRILLRERFDDHRRYAYAEEVQEQTGIARRRLDMVVVDCFKSNGYAIEGIEVKISKADLRKELEDSSKHCLFYEHLDYYSLAAPSSIVDESLIPKQWGLYYGEHSEGGELSMRCRRKPLSLHDELIKTVDKAFIASLFRAMWKTMPSDTQLDAAHKEGYESGLKDAGVYDYKARIERLERDLEAHRELRNRLNIWGGAGGIEDAIKEFEAFRALNLSTLIRELKWMLNRNKETSKEIRGIIKLLGCDSDD